MGNFIDVNKLNNLSDVKFYFGDFKVKLTEILNRVSPMGKVAFISFSKTHEKFGKVVLSSVSAANCKVISLIMPEPARSDIEYMSLPFNFPEDVRAVFVIDRELFRAASYFSQVKIIPLIFAPDSACLGGTLEKIFYVKNGDKFDKVSGTEDIYILIDEKIIERDIAVGYAFNMARLTTLLDYKIVSAAQGKVNIAAYNLILEGVTETYKILSEKSEKRALFVFYNGLKIALADRIEGFSFINTSSERVAACIYSGGLTPSPQAELYYSLRILELFAAAFNVKEEREIFPDYLSRAEKIAKTFNVSQKTADEKLLENITSARKFLSKAMLAMNNIRAETEELLTHESGILATFYSIGGKGNAVDGSVIKYAGDVFSVNTLSFLRETGLTD